MVKVVHREMLHIRSLRFMSPTLRRPVGRMMFRAVPRSEAISSSAAHQQDLLQQPRPVLVPIRRVVIRLAQCTTTKSVMHVFGMELEASEGNVLQVRPTTQ